MMYFVDTPFPLFNFFFHRIVFQGGEKLCAIPTAGLQEEKHSDHVSMI